MIVTPHAAERWEERFPGLSLPLEYERARRKIGPKLRRILAAHCPAHKRFIRPEFAGVYYRMTGNRIVFVMRPPETIVTVFRLAENVESVVK